MLIFGPSSKHMSQLRPASGLALVVASLFMVVCSALIPHFAHAKACSSDLGFDKGVIGSFVERYYRTTSRSHLMSRERFKDIFWTLDPKTQTCILGEDKGQNRNLSRGEFVSIIAPNKRGASPYTRTSSDCGIGRSRKSCVLSMRMIINDGLWTPLTEESNNALEASDSIDKNALDRLEDEMAPARLQAIGDVLKKQLNSFRDSLLEERYQASLSEDKVWQELKDKRDSLDEQLTKVKNRVYDRLREGADDAQTVASDRTRIAAEFLTPSEDEKSQKENADLREAQKKFGDLISEVLEGGEVDPERFLQLKREHPEFAKLLKEESVKLGRQKKASAQAIEDVVQMYELKAELIQTRDAIRERPEEIRKELEQHLDRSLFYEDAQTARSSAGIMGPELFQCIVEREVSAPNPSERDAVRSVLLEDALQEAIQRRQGEARRQLAIEKKELDRLGRLLAQERYQPLASNAGNQRLRKSYQQQFQDQVELARQKSRESRVSYYLPEFNSGYQDRYRHKRYNNLLRAKIRELYSEEEAESLLRKVSERASFFEENLRYHPYRLNYQFCERAQPRFGSTAYGFAQFTYQTFKGMCSKGQFRYSALLADPCNEISQKQKRGELSEDQAELEYSNLYHSAPDNVPMQVDMMISHIYFHPGVKRGVSEGDLSYRDIARSVQSYYGSQSIEKNTAYGSYVSSCHRRRLQDNLRYASDRITRKRIEETLSNVSR